MLAKHAQVASANDGVADEKQNNWMDAPQQEKNVEDHDQELSIEINVISVLFLTLCAFVVCAN